MTTNCTFKMPLKLETRELFWKSFKKSVSEISKISSVDNLPADVKGSLEDLAEKVRNYAIKSWTSEKSIGFYVVLNERSSLNPKPLFLSEREDEVRQFLNNKQADGVTTFEKLGSMPKVVETIHDAIQNSGCITFFKKEKEEVTNRAPFVIHEITITVPMVSTV